MASANQSHLVSSNEKYASSFDKADLPIPPAKKYLVVTCMDARIDPVAAFGVELGDAHIIRNAGGQVQDAIRSIVISQQLLGTKEILLIKHTGCGMLTFKNEDAYAVVEERIGSEAVAELKRQNIDFFPFPELDSAVKDEVNILKSSKLIAGDVTISGWIYEVESGKVRQVV